MPQTYTPEFRKKIVRLHEEEGRTYKSITAEYGVSKASISNVRRHIVGGTYRTLISAQVLNSYTCGQLLCCMRNLRVPDIPAYYDIHLHHGVYDKYLRFLTEFSRAWHSNPPSDVFGSCNKHLDRYQSAAEANASQIHYDVVR